MKIKWIIEENKGTMYYYLYCEFSMANYLPIFAGCYTQQKCYNIMHAT